MSRYREYLSAYSLADAPWSDVDAWVWAAVVFCMQISGACMPTHRQLLLRLIGEEAKVDHLQECQLAHKPHYKKRTSRVCVGEIAAKREPSGRSDEHYTRHEERKMYSHAEVEKSLFHEIPCQIEEESEAGPSRGYTPSIEWIVWDLSGIARCSIEEDKRYILILPWQLLCS